ncbi:hypothetical protein ACFPCW_26705 [Vibrio thalassae]|uniref:hypothetical protein n=1 Tax=Vibrio thalassae TaxID=1243014 RepID=UPI003622BE72
MKLADNVILLLMEIHTFDGYDYSAYMMINKDLQVLVPITRMRQDVLFGRSDELRVENALLMVTAVRMANYSALLSPQW